MINDPVLYYTCDPADTSGSTVTDRGSGGNSGTLDGSPGTAAGKIGGAITFNGSTQYIDAGSGSSLNIAGAITLAAWVNVAAFPSGSNLVVIQAKKYNGTSIGYYFDIYANSGTPLLRVGSIDLSSATHQATWPITGWSVGAWHHVVGLYTGAAWQIYFDGSLVASVSDGMGAVVVSSTRLLVGALDLTGSIQRLWDGDLDELRIYNRALSAGDVTELYNFTGMIPARSSRAVAEETESPAPRQRALLPITAPFVASTSFTTQRINNTTLVTVTPLLTGTVFYFWYLDGVYQGQTSSPSWTFILTAGEQGRIDVLQSNNPDFDPIANAPVRPSSTRTLEFVRSLDSTIDRYRIEQQIGSGSWEVLAFVRDDPRKWSYRYQTPRLTDLTLYAWRVIPMNAAGNDGTSVSLGSELIVRVPDSPDFTAAFDAVHDQVLFAAA